MVLDRQHVAGESRRGIAGRLLEFLLEPATHILRVRCRIKGLGVRFLELPLELRDPVMLGDFRCALSSLLADILGFVVELFFVFGCFSHAINLVSAFAVKSTMGTTRA